MLKNVANYGWIIVLLLTGPVYGDTVFGIYAGAGSWQQSFSGDVTSGTTQVDVEDDLALEDENNNIFYLALEHGVPVLPNLRVQHAKVAVSGDSTLTRTIEFNGTIFNLTDAVVTDVEISQTDLVLYYEVLDNVVSLDIGMAVRKVEGFFEIATTLEVARAEFDGVLPLLYGRVRADLPLTGLWLGAEVQGLGYDGNRLIDANAQVGWESPLGLGVEGGWRMFQFELADFDDFSSVSLDISGPYFALNFHF
ncbi:MAG: TIGR04219 family outer membrane beta-barrel protein [Proteobacteria bacterium]|nr:TIGR04219 family outer membrane beta-barrel protein [Pseudomonadota bacterium]